MREIKQLRAAFGERPGTNVAPFHNVDAELGLKLNTKLLAGYDTHAAEGAPAQNVVLDGV